MLAFFLQLAFHFFNLVHSLSPDLILGSYPVKQFQLDVMEGSQSFAVDLVNISQHIVHMLGSSLQAFFPSSFFLLSHIFFPTLYCLLLWRLSL
jgi:hypothetical protein